MRKTDIGGKTARVTGIALNAVGKIVTEKELQLQVIDLAHLFGWKVAHFRPALNRDGTWVTPVQADGAGFPDLVCVRRDRLLFCELKRELGKPTPEQGEWLQELSLAEKIEVWIWRPQDSKEIEEVLK